MAVHRTRNCDSVQVLFLFLLFIIEEVVSYDYNQSQSSIRTKRAVDGVDAVIEEFLHTVSLLVGERRQIKCGGSIVGPYHVVTACHCINQDLHPKNYFIRAGSSYWNKNGNLHDVVMFACDSRAKKLPNSDNIVMYDIAILMVNKPFELDSETQHVIKFWKANQQPWYNQKAKLVSWGIFKNVLVFEADPVLKKPTNIQKFQLAPEQLQLSDLELTDPRYCREITSSILKMPHVPSQICAKSVNGQICRGDSGSGIMIDKQLAGVVSYTISDEGGCSKVTMFADLSMSTNWLKEFINSSVQILNKAVIYDLRGLDVEDAVGNAMGDIKDAPHAVSILKNDWFICSGSIISQSHVLSAAHCFPDSDARDLMIRAGSSYWHESGSLYKVKKITLHPNAQNLATGWVYDVAILNIVDSFKFHDNNQLSMPLFSPLDFEDIYEPNVTAWISGWEDNDIISYNDSVQTLVPTLRIQSIDVVLGSARQCYFNNRKQFQENFNPTYKNVILCTEAGQISTATSGYSGSGVVVNAKLFGILSGSFKQHNKNMYKYTALCSISTWIESVIESQTELEL